MNKTSVIHHSADFDGIFCREIARKFLPNAEFIGWDFKDAQLELPDGPTYILDLPVDRVLGFTFDTVDKDRALRQIPPNLIWIDHHKSSIETHPSQIPGYRIDGVAACRLTWQWFMSLPENAVPNFAGRGVEETVPSKQAFIDRKVSEPLAVRLAGEYDIWDKRDPRAELFQHGLRSRNLGENMWELLLTPPHTDADGKQGIGEITVEALLEAGEAIQFAKTQENADIITNFGFDLEFEGLRFLACNHARFNSHLFTAGLRPDHDACFGFKWTGKGWIVSLYHAPGKEHHDLSLIAVKHGGGGHRGACGFTAKTLPFI